MAESNQIYYKELPVSELTFGINRPQSWWDKHPNAGKMIERMKVSISKEGIRNPLNVRKDRGVYVVNIGNQRLKALQELGIETAPCIVSGISGEGHITTLAELRTYFKDGIDPKSLGSLVTIRPNDIDLWDGNKQFGEQR